jgi:hypothetical protein
VKGVQSGRNGVNIGFWLQSSDWPDLAVELAKELMCAGMFSMCCTACKLPEEKDIIGVFNCVQLGFLWLSYCVIWVLLLLFLLILIMLDYMY